MRTTGFGRYELVERLAERASSELFVVKVSGEHGFRRHIVLKRLRDDAQSTTFIEDAKLAAKLSHAKIVQTLELGRVDEAPYVATDYVDGVDLLGLLREVARTKRTIDTAVAVWVASELLDALDYAHTFVDDDKPLPIIHGRLSPSKVLLGSGGEVKLCDFGIARRLDIGNGGQDYGHMSPEQVMEAPLDARSDVFGVGILLAEMLMRRRLFAAHNEFDVLLAVRDVRLQRLDVSRVDAELAGITRKALEKKPDDRWQTAAAFRDALDAWLFSHRATAMKQQLAGLVASVRAEVDRWRREGKTSTPEFDDLPELTAPIQTWARGSVPKKVAIPPRDLPRGTTGMKPLPKPPEVDPDARVARVQIARGTEQQPPLPKPQPKAERPKYPSDPIPALPKNLRVADKPTSRPKTQGSIGKGIEDLLPARTPSTATQQTTQLLSQEQLAKAGEPPLPKLAKLERPADETGEFSRHSPLRVMFQLLRTRATGLLAITHDEVRKDVYIRDGELAGVWSNDKRDLFGSYLVTQQVLSEGELAMALATMSHYGGKLGDTLVGLGLLDRVEVFRHLTRHARMKVVDICTWTMGSYSWYAGNEHPRDSFPLEAEGFTMLGEAALAMKQPVIDAWLAKHCGDKLVIAKPQRVPPEVFGARGCAEVLVWIDGTRTLGAIVDSHADRGRVARLLYLFIACELVRIA